MMPNINIKPFFNFSRVKINSQRVSNDLEIVDEMR